MEKEIPHVFRLAANFRFISRYQNSQNNGYWCTNSSLSTHNVSQHDVGRRPSTKNDASCRCPYQREMTHEADWNHSRARNGAIRTTLFTTNYMTKNKKKGVSTLGTKRNLDYHTLYEPLTCIWRATPINEEQFLQFTVIRDETWANHTTFETTKIISPSEDIQSNTVGKEHHDNCLERPQMCASCILPWPRWHCQELLWYNCEVTARH